MDYIRITDDNIEKEHICCAMSGKQGVIKKEWLKQRFKEGLVFCRSTERGKCFIEYIPAENAWVPIIINSNSFSCICFLRQINFKADSVKCLCRKIINNRILIYERNESYTECIAKR